MHNQPREPQPYEDYQAKSIQEFGWTSQEMDWGWGQGLDINILFFLPAVERRECYQGDLSFWLL